MNRMHLDAARINARLTQREVSEQLGVAVSTVSRWEAEKQFPPVQILRKMCDLYGCKMDDIFVPETLT